MHVGAGRERGAQRRVAGDVGHDAQLDLRVVGGHQRAPRRGDEGAPHAPALLGADRDVLQVGVGGGQPPGGGAGLVEGGVQAPGVGVQHLRQLAQVGGQQLGALAVLQNHARQLVLLGQLLEHVLGGGGGAGRRLAQRREAALGEQHLLQVARGVQVELAPADLEDARPQLLLRRVQLRGLRRQRRHVERHPGALHRAQHRRQRQLQLAVQPQQRGLALQPRPQAPVQAQGHVGVLGRVRRGARQRHRVEAHLLAPAARHLGVAGGLLVQVHPRQVVQVVARRAARGRVHHVGLEHAVVRRPGQLEAGARQDGAVVLQVVAELGQLRVGQERAERRQRRFPRQLRRVLRVGVPERHVGGAPRRRRQRHADQFGAVRVDRSGLGVDREHARGARPGGPVGERGRVQHQRVVARRGGALRLRRGGVQLAPELPQAVLLVQLAQRAAVGRAGRQRGQRRVQLQVAADGDQFRVQRQPPEAVAQLPPDRARDLRRVLDHARQRAVAPQPARRGLRPDLGHAGDVVGGVAGQRQVVDDALRRHLELALHPGRVQRLLVGVGQRHAAADQLRHVLVGREDDHRQPRLAAAPGQGADDVVGLDPRHAQQRQAERGDDPAQRVDLRAQLRVHRRPVGLVLRVQLVAEVLPRRVQHHRHPLRADAAQLLLDGVDGAVQRAGRPPVVVGEAGVHVVRPVQVHRGVDQKQPGARRSVRHAGARIGIRRPIIGAGATIRAAARRAARSRSPAPSAAGAALHAEPCPRWPPSTAS